LTKCIVPAAKTRKCYLVHQQLEYISRNLMAPLSYLSAPLLAEEIKIHYRAITSDALANLDDQFADYRRFSIGGKKFTIADCYLLAALDTAEATGIDFNQYPHIKDYYERMSKLDSVSQAKTKMLTNPTNTRGGVAVCC
jgi:glutathione S-transferase